MSSLRELVLYLAGILFLVLAKAKHSLRGYSTPKPFSIAETDRCIDYDVHVVEQWMQYGASFEGKTVLELGPGSDLGVGLYLLVKGATGYIAFDRHNLASGGAEGFYSRFSERYQVPQIAQALHQGSVKYIVSTDFDIKKALPAKSIDIVVSNAAFEHFSDVEKVARDLSQVVKPKGAICALIDLQTHSRWIRKIDPNNIYRYPDWLYRAFWFPGQPNRLRPNDYRRCFESAGWKNVSTEFTTQFDARGRGVFRRFSVDGELNALSVVLRAELP